MPSCQEVTPLLSLAQERSLKLSEKAQLKIHLVMCKRCARFNKNILTLRKTMQQFSNRED